MTSYKTGGTSDAVSSLHHIASLIKESFLRFLKSRFPMRRIGISSARIFPAVAHSILNANATEAVLCPFLSRLIVP
jgi:hypothetical protein